MLLCCYEVLTVMFPRQVVPQKDDQVCFVPTQPTVKLLDGPRSINYILFNSGQDGQTCHQ